MTATTMRAGDERIGRVILAFLGSLLIHLLVAGGFVFLVSYLPERVSEPDVAANEEPIQLVMARPVSPVPDVLQAVRIPDDAEEVDAVENPMFQADRSTRAASEASEAGADRLPSQDGKELPFRQLETRDYVAGAEAKPAIAEVPQEPVREMARAEPVVEPAATPRPTPVPDAAALAVLRPQATPEVRRAEAVRPAERPVEVRRAEPVRPAYQPESRQSRIVGDITNRGRASVAALGTPLGRYQKMLGDAVGSRWNFYTRQRIDLISIGTARIKFRVTERGEVEDLRIVRNTSNEAFATCTIQAIMDAEIPPIPPDVAESLDDRGLEVEYSFTVYAD